MKILVSVVRFRPGPPKSKGMYRSHLSILNKPKVSVNPKFMAGHYSIKFSLPIWLLTKSITILVAMTNKIDPVTSPQNIAIK